ncbi:hypothetical protein TVNIR_1910 [Thioalkalivibrio nitratireducens DSM 14787]|uniref:Uncharacterized protein n=2 Tax=Thioalkalivibrio nitratireducens TaxID=186931 RepID=L0DYY3_THIND|nr:hypothetical protein TVNIR_1910 [Thioalkalivibrio nitratireducens DSM 14787]
MVLAPALLLGPGVSAAAEDGTAGDAGAESKAEASVGDALPRPRPAIAAPGGRVPEQAAGVAMADGSPRLLFLNPEGRVVYRGRGADTVVDDDDEVEKPGGGYFQVHSRPEGLFLLWWQKLDDAGKHLYLRRVLEDEAEGTPVLGEPVKVNASNGVLPPPQLASDGTGRVAVVYHDERVARYRVFVTISRDGGETWPEQDVLLDRAEGRAPVAFEPFVTVSGERLVVTWRELVGGQQEEGTRFMVRVSDADWEEWSEPRELARFDQGFFTGDVLVDADGTPVILGYHQWERPGLYGFRSPDGGTTWEDIPPLPGTEELDEVSQTVAAVHDGVVHVLFTWRPEGRNEFNRPFGYRIGAGRLDAREGVWLGELERLDVGKDPDLTRSWNPALAVTPEGTLVAAWEDYREVRANIYLSRSVDGGESWSPAAAVEAAGDGPRRFPALHAEENAVTLFYEQFEGHREARRAFQMVPLGDDGWAVDALAAAAVGEGEATRERLMERVAEFWKLRVEGDHAAVYDYFDPAYRAIVNRQGYTSAQAQLQFLEQEVVGGDVHGRFGATVTQVKIAVPETIVEGEAFEMEPREDHVPQEWVWIDGDWHVVFGGGGRGGRSLLKY